MAELQLPSAEEQDAILVVRRKRSDHCTGDDFTFAGELDYDHDPPGKEHHFCIALIGVQQMSWSEVADDTNNSAEVRRFRRALESARTKGGLDWVEMGNAGFWNSRFIEAKEKFEATHLITAILNGKVEHGDVELRVLRRAPKSKYDAAKITENTRLTSLVKCPDSGY